MIVEYFIENKIKFKIFYFITYAEVHVKKVTEKKGHTIMGSFGFGCCLSNSCFAFPEELDGGGGSVRRRDTLHVVGGGQ